MRTRILLTSLIAVPSLLAAQSFQYTVKGKVGNLNAPAKAFLYYQSGKENKQDSAVIKNGSFEFRGTLPAPVRATLLVKHPTPPPETYALRYSDYTSLMLEKGTVVVTSTDSVYKAIVKGGPLNNDLLKLQARLKPVEEKRDQITLDYIAADSALRSSKEYEQAMTKKYLDYEKEEKSLLGDFIRENPTTIVTIYAINRYGGASPEVSEIEPLFTSLSEKVKNSSQGQELTQTINSLRATALGQVAPEIVQNDPEGKQVRLSDFRGKYVLVDFWASWCGPCRSENPNVVKAYNKYKDKDFTILGVSLDGERTKDAWLKAIKDDSLTWTHVSDLKDWKNEAAVKYVVQAIPQNFLLDKEGKIIAKNLRGDDLEKKLEEIIR